MLALARRFSKHKTERTLRFVAFVNEEAPYSSTKKRGSRVYTLRCRERGENIVAMLSLETIGYYDDTPGSQEYPAPFRAALPQRQGTSSALSATPAPATLCGKWWQRSDRTRSSHPKGAAVPEFVPGVGSSDHRSFWQVGYPALMVTDTAMFRYPYYHKPGDTIDKINFDRLARVVRGLEYVVAGLVGTIPTGAISKER